MKRSSIAGIIALAGTTGLMAISSAEGAQFRSNGSIEAVTVYRGQALVTRSIDLDLEPGIHEVAVGDLPPHLVPGSLHAEAGTDLAIRSVRYREQPVREDVREEVQLIDDQLKDLSEQMARLARRAETITGRKAYVKNLESFTSQNAMTELSKGVLDASTLKELSEFIFAQQEEIEQMEIELRTEQTSLKDEMSQLEREKASLGARSSRTAREAVITVEVREGAGHDLNLRYLVNHATWDPSHTVRADISGEELVAEYFASIQQTSGEDWNDVEMKLSTATPSLVARAPQLTAMLLELAPSSSLPRQATMAQQKIFQEGLRAAELSRNSNIAVFGNSRSAADNYADLDRSLNRFSINSQLLELQAGQKFMLTDSAAPNSAGHTVTYNIPGRTGLPSRPERQQIQIASTQLDGEFYKVAIPLLTGYVYEEAKVVNGSSNVMLSGPVMTYADGQFVGQSMFDDIAIGEEMIVGLGINSDLRSERVVIDQKETVNGGNRVLELTVELSVQNFGTEDTVVRLIDRLPQVDGQQVRLTIANDGSESSPFVDENEALIEVGQISWNLNVPAKAIADKAATVTYTIILEHDKQMGLVATDR